jgi:iduronate 2-sulfatase
MTKSDPVAALRQQLHYNRREFLSAAGMAPAVSRQVPKPVNVLFIVADDLNTSLGCYGNQIVKTPNIDRLASRGVLFDRAYCQFPLCAPSRASFLSGRRPETTRVWTLHTPTRKYMQDAVMLPEFFRKAGWFTAGIGKIYHNGPEHEDPRSWDFRREPPTGGKAAAAQVLERFVMPKPRNHTMEWARLNTPDREMPDGILAHQASDLIRERAKDGKPFFLGVGFHMPHSPYAAPSKYFDLYDWARIPVPRVSEGYEKSLPEAAWYERADQVRPTEEETRRHIAAYYACVSFVDAQVGHLLQTLDDVNLRSNTVVVLLGDNGYHLGEHGMWHKMTLFEESTRVPLIIHAPGMRAAAGVCRGPVELVDLYPTLAQICELKPPSGLEGASLVPWLKDPSHPGKKAARSMVGRHEDRSRMTSAFTYTGKTVRTARWRYTEWDGGRKGVELYDEHKDPKELKNLSGECRYRSVVADLKRCLV